MWPYLIRLRTSGYLLEHLASMQLTNLEAHNPLVALGPLERTFASRVFCVDQRLTLDIRATIELDLELNLEHTLSVSLAEEDKRQVNELRLDPESPSCLLRSVNVVQLDNTIPPMRRSGDRTKRKHHVARTRRWENF